MGLVVVALPSIVTVGASSSVSVLEIVRVTRSAALARDVVALLDAMEVVTVGAVLSTVTKEPSVVLLNADAPIFPFSS